MTDRATPSASSRAVRVPAEDAPYYLAQGWRIVDDVDGDLVLAPPDHFESEAA